MAEVSMQDPNYWKTAEFRQKIVAKLDECLRSSAPSAVLMGKTGVDLENQLFMKSKSKDEYLGLISKVIMHIKPDKGNEMGLQLPGANPAGSFGSMSGGSLVGVGQPDPISALQNLTRPGLNPQSGLGAGQQGGLVPPGMAGMAPRQQFAGYGQQTMSSAGRGMLQAGARAEMFMNPGQMQAMGRGGPMMNPANQQFSMVMGGPAMSQMQQQQQQQQQLQQQYHQQQMQMRPNMAFPGGMDMQGLGQQGLGVPIPAPTNIGAPGSVGSMMIQSPGNLQSSQSPGPGTGIAPSPARMSYGAPSPGSALNTPGNPASVGPVGASRGMSEEQAYLEKWRQLQKYIEPLKRMINRIDKDEDREVDLNKMKNLLNILSDSSKRLPISTLLKCEQVLEKQLEFPNKVSAATSSASECHPCQPLLDAIAAHVKSPMLNHTLQRTFGPTVRALHGPPLWTDSPPAKRFCADDVADYLPSSDDEIPDVVQGEIARLHSRFVVTFDPAHHTGSKVIQLQCRLEDKKLPNIPPITVTLPENYPQESAIYQAVSNLYDSTPFLCKVRDVLKTEIEFLSGFTSLTAMLNLWEVCVRKSCTPAAGSSVAA